MYAAATRSAIQQMQEQERSLERLYPKMIGQQLGTARQVAGELDNQYLAKTRGVLDDELKAASRPSGIEAELTRQARADLSAGPTDIQRMMVNQAQQELAAGPTAIQQQLLSGAQGDLALGRSLSPEELRDAQQSARSAFSARGLGTGAGASAAEILNRDSFARQREAQRRQAAMGMENYVLGQQAARTQRAASADEYSLGQQAQRRQFALGANQLDLARRGRRVVLAEGYGALDPFARGLDAAFGLGQATMGQGTQLIGNTFNNAVNQAGNVESFNRNMQAGMYNNWQNNNAAIQAANITGRASTNAGMMSMFGGLAQGAGAYFSDERMKKDIKQTGKDGVLGLKTYEYRYKGEDKDAPKRTGFMAQDVAKVLPEAVEEVNYRGKKRLAIKPMVIGQTLAAALASQQDAMFADGYTVGKGFKG
jgi:hypothetical protein